MAKKEVCLITESEIQAFINSGIEPNHKHHRHLSFNEALDMINSDLACSFDGLPAALVEHSSNGYIWKTRLSFGYNTFQMRRIVQG